MKNPFLPYTPFEVNRLQQMKRYVDAFHIAHDNGDFEAYRNAIADLAELYATTREQKSAELWKGTAQLARRSDSRDYLSQTATMLEGIVEAHAIQISISFERMVTGAEKYDSAMGFTD
jgi:hypothetical protein